MVQTLDHNVSLGKDDYGECAIAIACQEHTDMDMKWVFGYWDRDKMKRECWDTNVMSMVIPRHEYIWSSHGVDPYKFMYDDDG